MNFDDKPGMTTESKYRIVATRLLILMDAKKEMGRLSDMKKVGEIELPADVANDIQKYFDDRVDSEIAAMKSEMLRLLLKEQGGV